MIRVRNLVAAAVLIAASSSLAGAAPSGVKAIGGNVTDNITRVHGCHASCERGPNGWHRHVGNSCKRRQCRPWRGKGRRPDHCVRVGPVWYCEY